MREIVYGLNGKIAKRFQIYAIWGRLESQIQYSQYVRFILQFVLLHEPVLRISQNLRTANFVQFSMARDPSSCIVLNLYLKTYVADKKRANIHDRASNDHTPTHVKRTSA